MQSIIEKELSSTDKIFKPDFNSKAGREFLAFYLQTKFKQVLTYDKRTENPVFISVNPDFIPKFSKRLINSPTKRIMIGITGESASGKSTICQEIKSVIEQLSMPVAVLSTDNYFNDISELIKKHGSFDQLVADGYDIDAPSSYQLGLLRSDLEDLSQGIDIKTPMYVPNGTGVSIPESIEVKANKIIVVEGIASMFEEIRDIFDVKIYIEADEQIRKERFVKRACSERNQTPQSALDQWDYLLQKGVLYVKPCAKVSDFILNGCSDLQYFSRILQYIHTVTNNFGD